MKDKRTENDRIIKNGILNPKHNDFKKLICENNEWTHDLDFQPNILINHRGSGTHHNDRMNGIFFSILKDSHITLSSLLDHAVFYDTICSENDDRKLKTNYYTPDKKYNILHYVFLRKSLGCLLPILHHTLYRPELINEQNEDGDTPLHIAIKKDYPSGGVYMLLKYGSNPFIPNKLKETPFVLLLFREKDKIILDEPLEYIIDKYSDDVLRLACSEIGEHKELENILSKKGDTVVARALSNIINESGVFPEEAPKILCAVTGCVKCDTLFPCHICDGFFCINHLNTHRHNCTYYREDEYAEQTTMMEF